jgi:hypothetical protein
VYVLIELPRDRLLQEALRFVVRERWLAGSPSCEEMQSLIERTLQPFLQAPAEAVKELCEFIARTEVRTGSRRFFW